jgi:acetyltransferase-like isoleucine patch superfamily enzyme
MKIRSSQGNGSFNLKQFKSLGKNVVFEKGVLIFHPEHIIIGHNVYIGHNSILKAYYKNEMIIGDHAWIGPGCFFHSAGGIIIGKQVGIGPMVKILTSFHSEVPINQPLLNNEIKYKPVTIEDGSDIGIGTIILPGITIGKGAIIGAGAVITKDVPQYGVYAGNPAKLLRPRGKK